MGKKRGGKIQTLQCDLGGKPPLLLCDNLFSQQEKWQRHKQYHIEDNATCFFFPFVGFNKCPVLSHTHALQKEKEFSLSVFTE